ncbi:hypothetical protein H2203_001190 [Taxawa tesnikishii (nom. ined.)]|nr:hypothetical protein H2203_001190 [Dothideales sp. JES 119]
MTVFDPYTSLLAAATPAATSATCAYGPSTSIYHEHPYDYYDISTITSYEDGVDDFDGPRWIDPLDAESNAIEAGLLQRQPATRTTRPKGLPPALFANTKAHIEAESPLGK